MNLERASLRGLVDRIKIVQKKGWDSLNEIFPLVTIVVGNEFFYSSETWNRVREYKTDARVGIT